MKAERWFLNYRFHWISETLRVFGFINRTHIMRKFGLSQPHASLDLKRFAELNPRRMAYDLSRKCYVATKGRKR